MKPVAIKYATRCRRCERPLGRGEVAWGEINELAQRWTFECDPCYGETAKEAKARKNRKTANDTTELKTTLGNESDRCEEHTKLTEPVRKTWLETAINNAKWRLQDDKMERGAVSRGNTGAMSMMPSVEGQETSTYEH